MKRNRVEPEAAVAPAFEEDWDRGALVDNMEFDMNYGGDALIEIGRSYSRFLGDSRVIIV